MSWENILKTKISHAAYERKIFHDMKKFSASLADYTIEHELEKIVNDDSKFKNLIEIKEVIYDDLVDLYLDKMNEALDEMLDDTSGDIQEVLNKNKNEILDDSYEYFS